ncbi:ScbA/BarX family gamma-butyrolactone biosynthesis protein [Streptomyces sp. NPDC086549]|uniref:ScbA/BarX family gamma-butyrolactone biosynthesis protein n=1 Tax=Streptomyces sp. NPDC086549 TaxID=3365752 RepID=UPI0037FDFDDE
MTALTFQKEKPPISIPGREAARVDTDLPPKLTTTVPREYVHRSSHAEVFLTGCEKHSDTHYTLAGQWPRAHTFFTSPDGLSHDPMQAAETIRQVGLFLAHAEFDVPLGHQFLLWDIHTTTHQEHMDIGAGPSDLTLTANVTEMRRRGARVAEFTLDIGIVRAGQLCAVGGGRFTCLSPATYRRLRGSAGGDKWHNRKPWPSEVRPHTLGKLVPFDVVLSPTEQGRRWLLNPDPRHPILFDHSGDHFPGMVLLEAARQAASALLQPSTLTVSSAHTEFHRYAEFDRPCWIEASLPPTQAAGSPTVLVTGRQGEDVVFTSLLTGTLRLPGAGGTGAHGTP